MSVAARTGEQAYAPRAALTRIGVGATPLLAALVAVSFVLRTAVGWLRPTPTFFADEYIYAELARSLAESGRPLIRGAGAEFPALLQPLLTAPAWLLDDVGASFRLVQTAGALAMSLAAVPVFLLARRVGLGPGISVALAALALVVPDLVYAGWVTAEAIAYPLALGAVAAGTAALARPSARLQAGFLALAALAAFARLQFVILPLCYLAAVLVLGLCERRLRAVLREQALVLGLLALPVLGFLVAGPQRALGFYESAVDPERYPPELAVWVGKNALVLLVGSGAVLVPGALLGLWLAFRRPRSREELAFAALAVPVVLGLLVQAGAWGGETGRVQERYFFYAVPLVGVAFALYASRGWPHRLAHAALAAGLVALLARVPLAGVAAWDGKTNSPSLMAIAELARVLGGIWLATLAVALGASLSLAVVVYASWRGQPTRLALGLAAAACAAAYGTAVSFGVESSTQVRSTVLGPAPSFVEESGVRGAALLQTRLSDRGRGSLVLFWNPSVDLVYVLPETDPPDGFAATRLTIAADGTLLAEGRPVTRPLVADGVSDTLRFRSSREVASSPIYRLVVPDGRQRLALYAPGRAEDGWLGLAGAIRLWPETVASGLAGTLSLRLTAPPGVDGPIVVQLAPDGGAAQEVVLEPGAARTLSFPVCAAGPWQVGFEAPSTGAVDTRFVSVRSSEPVFRPDASACG